MWEDPVDFSVALKVVKAGKRIQRSGWNGKGMWVQYHPAQNLCQYDGTMISVREYLMMRTAQGDYVPWLASQTDILATDWMVLD